MTKQHRFALLFSLTLAIAVSLVPLRMEAQKTDRAKQLGGQMMCMCGCNQILTQCNHVGCTVSAAMIKELDQMVAANDSDATIFQNFVQQYGPAVMAAPPSTGFNSLAWYIPPMAFVLGLGIVTMVIRMWRHREVASAAAASATPAGGAGTAYAVPDSQIERIRAKVDQETED
jgi:cytochrome c-type biogenesis protein CcmH